MQPHENASEPLEVGRFAWERALLEPGSGVKGTQLLVLLAVGTYMNADGSNAYASQATLSAATGLADRTVRQHLRSAVDDGWLQRTARGHRRGDVGVASVHRASLPAAARRLEGTPTGVGMPQGAEPNRQMRAPQPADEGTPTGVGMPPTKEDHVTKKSELYALARPMVARCLDELDPMLSTLAARHGAANIREALQAVAVGEPAFKFPSELKQSLDLELAAVASRRAGARAAATAAQLADRPPVDLERNRRELAQIRAELDMPSRRSA